MRGYNKAIIMGNVVRKPELRYTQSNKAVASFSVAVNRVWSDANGDRQEETTYMPVVAWGRSGEIAEKYLNKGSGVLVEGRIQTRSYDDKDGNKRYITEIVSESIQFVGGRTQENRGQGEQGGYHPQDNRDWNDERRTQRVSYNSKASASGFETKESIEHDRRQSATQTQQGGREEEVDIPF